MTVSLIENIEDFFFEIRSEYKRLLLRNSSDFTELKKLCSHWEDMVCKENKYVLYGYRDIYYDELVPFIFFLRNAKDGELRGFHDRIFINIFGFSKKIPRGVTNTFSEFIKGITYFSDQAEDVFPVYHRLSSCGSGDDAFRTSYHKCTPDMDEIQKKKIKRQIFTCYIERLIYDDMYCYYSPEEKQDEGHQKRLQLTKDDFSTCFPRVDVVVGLEYDQFRPIKLTLVLFKDGREIFTKTYVKTIIFDSNVLFSKTYSPITDCMKQMDGRTYIKSQNFRKKAKWKLSV